MKNCKKMQEEMRKAAKESGVKLYEDGEYEGKGKGFGGDIVVKVIIKDDEIESAEVVSADNETPEYIEVAKALLNDVISYQSSDVDTISGATLSSNGILEGVRNALDKAKAKG